MPTQEEIDKMFQDWKSEITQYLEDNPKIKAKYELWNSLSEKEQDKMYMDTVAQWDSMPEGPEKEQFADANNFIQN